MTLDRNRQRIDVARIVIIWRHETDRRLRAHVLQRARDLVHHRRRRRCGILRIERHHQNALAALRGQRVDPRLDRRIAVAHAPVHDHMGVVADRRRELFGLRTRDRFQRRFIPVGIPDFQIILRLLGGTDLQHDAVEDDLPDQSVVLDHARIGQDLSQIDAHALCVGGVRRAEIDQQNADA